jgi:hypothetical protein
MSPDLELFVFEAHIFLSLALDLRVLLSLFGDLLDVDFVSMSWALVVEFSIFPLLISSLWAGHFV